MPTLPIHFRDNRLNWLDFVRKPNPVASALMTKMRIAPGDRPRVKLECLRMLATLKLDKARATLMVRAKRHRVAANHRI
jgi:hypothetical protein